MARGAAPLAHPGNKVKHKMASNVTIRKTTCLEPKMPILKETVRLALKAGAAAVPATGRSGQLATLRQDQSRELNDLAGDAAMARIIKPRCKTCRTWKGP